MKVIKNLNRTEIPSILYAGEGALVSLKLTRSAIDLANDRLTKLGLNPSQIPSIAHLVVLSEWDVGISDLGYIAKFNMQVRELVESPDFQKRYRILNDRIVSIKSGLLNLWFLVKPDISCNNVAVIPGLPVFGVVKRTVPNQVFDFFQSIPSSLEEFRRRDRISRDLTSKIWRI